MLNAFGHLKWLAIVAAVLAEFVLGGVWFKLVVSRAYVVALGVEQKSEASALVGPLACMTVTAITSAVLLRALGLTSYDGAVAFGALVGIGYLVPMVVNIALNPLFPRPLLYSFINAPFFIVGSVLVSVILVALR